MGGTKCVHIEHRVLFLQLYSFKDSCNIAVLLACILLVADKVVKEAIKNRKSITGWTWKNATIALVIFLFLIGIPSMQGGTAPASHGVTRKRSTKRLKSF